VSAEARPGSPGPVRDVVIVGAGVAGLAAAWRLGGRDLLVLERDSRVGGRIRSLPRGERWINLGAHLFPGEGSAVHELVRALQLETALLEIPGSKSAVYFNGKVHAPPRAELLPLTLSLSIRERAALAVAGLRLRHGAAAWRRSQRRLPDENEAEWCRRAAGFGADRTLAQLLGPMPSSVDQIFRASARRAAGELDELSAGAGLSLFGALWVGKGSTSLRNIRGGSGRVSDAAEKWLGNRLCLEAPVRSVEVSDGHAVVTVQRSGVSQRIVSRHAIVALPAPLVSDVVKGLPDDVDRSLASVTYGPFVSMGVLTREQETMPWTRVYAVTTPGLSFDMLFNHANPLRHHREIGGGGSLMCYAGGRSAEVLMDLPVEEIRERFLGDLHRVYPQLRGLVEETVVQKWPIGNVHGTTRTNFEAMWRYSRRPASPVRFAGDYFAPLGGSLDAAARSGFEAADAVLADLAHPAAFEGRLA
jgi:oxygen-dependent protoporphyrinogen oxidase